MKTHTLNTFYKTLGLIALTASPLLAQDEAKPDMKDKEMTHSDMAMEMSKLVAVIRPVGDSKVQGTVVFERTADGVKVTAKIGGFEPGTKHGFHVHEFGDLASPDAKSAGGHFNPDGHDHALPDKEMRHGGDLGNLVAGDDGNATLEITVKNLKLDAGKHGILGRAVIIHDKEDDGGQPTGNAGDRIGAGVIGISMDAKMGGETTEEEHKTKEN